MDNNWTIKIESKTNWWRIDFKEIWSYRDLLFLFVRRDFVSVYKQTILGPLWFFIQPVITTLMFTLIFGKVAKIPTDGIPHIVFYMSGIVTWNYFASCLTNTSATFTRNQGLFGKVYFPRIIVPLSLIVSGLLKFVVQFLLFLGFYFYYIMDGAAIAPNWSILYLPLYLIMMAGLGLGLGIIISSLTTKYRDLQYFVGFGTRLLMYASPVVYPLSLVEGNLRWIVLANPVSSIIEGFKYSFLGHGDFNPSLLLYSFLFMCVIMLVGLILFHRVEKNFMDTV